MDITSELNKMANEILNIVEIALVDDEKKYNIVRKNILLIINTKIRKLGGAREEIIFTK